jgi:hypothetical protein
LAIKLSETAFRLFAMADEDNRLDGFLGLTRLTTDERDRPR